MTQPDPTATFDQKTLNRFWSKVDKTDHCWLWTGATSTSGYGYFSTGGQRFSAHRFSYLLAHGGIPEGLVVDHLCHGWDENCKAEGNSCPHRACLNPDHLEAVTERVNILRGRGVSGEASRRTHCPKGHPYDETNTLVEGNARRCRTCREAKAAVTRTAPPPGQRSHCPQGHPYSEENTYRAPNGHRKCRTCKRERDLQARASCRRRKTSEARRLDLSEALDLGTGAPWEAIYERVSELRRLTSKPVLPASVDRADVLREAADKFDQHAAQLLDGIGDKAVFVAKALRDQAAVWSEAAETLRRLAAEARAAGDYARALATPPSAETAAYIRDRVAAETRNTTETDGEPCTGRVCAGSGCSHEQTASDLIAHDQDTGLYDDTPPCGPVPDECGDEPCANHEREQAHAEGEHCFCGPECDGQDVTARLERGRTQLVEAMSAVSEDRTCCGWASDWARTLHAEGGIWETLGRAVGWPVGNYDQWVWVSWDEAAVLYATPPAGGAPQPKEAP